MSTAVITGATSGIGLAAAKQLLEQGFNVICTGRNSSKCTAIENELKQIYGKNVKFFVCDNAALKDVKKLSSDILDYLNKTGKNKIDVLINNAGCYMSKKIITAEGLETQIAVNFLSSYLLTELLMPRLQNSENARVIFTGSRSHYKTYINPDKLFKNKKLYFGLFAYKKSKLALTMLVHALNVTYGGKPRFYTADPGLVNTDIGQKQTKGIANIVWRIRKKFGITADQSANNITYLSTGDIKTDNYSYYYNKQAKKPSNASLNINKCMQIYQSAIQKSKQILDK